MVTPHQHLEYLLNTAKEVAIANRIPFVACFQFHTASRTVVYSTGSTPADETLLIPELRPLIREFHTFREAYAPHATEHIPTE